MSSFCKEYADYVTYQGGYPVICFLAGYSDEVHLGSPSPDTLAAGHLISI